MVSRRSLLPAGLAWPLISAREKQTPIAMHMATTLAAGYRRSLEAYAEPGIRYVELLVQPTEEFLQREGVSAARRLLRAAAGRGIRDATQSG